MSKTSLNSDYYRNKLKDSKRIVIKVGTSTLTFQNGKLNLVKIEKLSRIISNLSNMGKEVVLVSSGAIGVGVGIVGLKEKPQSIMKKQALAAVGQCQLMHIYNKFFNEYCQTVAQILLTRDIIDSPERLRNVKNTFETLIDMNIVPIVNENDSVSVEEIKFGDNDTLSALVSRIIGADLLIILSDIDGLYDSNPRTNANANLISIVTKITSDIEKIADGEGSDRGTGGMITKIEAAKLAVSSGIDLVIINGENPNTIMDILDGKDVGTLFISEERK